MKRGFTLIELLAVIVILAIIALIATPIILNIIKDSKEEARERSIDNIIHTARIYAAKEGLEENKAVHIKDIKNMIDGEKPENGIIYFDKKGEVAFSFDFKDEVYVKSFEGEVEKEDQVYYIKVATTENIETKPFLEGPITKQQIEKVTTVPTNKVPSDVLGSWDVSEKGNGKVMAWYTDIDSNGLYEVYIGQTGGVKANLDSTKLFNYMINAKEIDLTYLDTSNATNMLGMFQSCKNLEKIIGLENFDTSEVTDMKGLFSACYKLQFINLNSFDTSKVTEMTAMFQNCLSLKEIDVSSFDTSNVTDMTNLFWGCSSLTNLDINKWNTSNVSSMLGLFRNCSKLEKLDVSNWDTSKVTLMGEMFRACSKLTSIDISAFDTSNVTSMAYMFQGCGSLTSINLSNLDTSEVKNMSGMFDACVKLEEINFSNWDTSQVTNMSGMFSWCNKLIELDLRNFDTSKVTNINYMFRGTQNLKPIYVGEKWTINEGVDVSQMFTNNAKTTSVEELCEPNSIEEWCIVQ